LRIRIVAAASPRIKGRVAKLSHGRLLNQTDNGMMAMNSCFGTRISGENTGVSRSLQRRQKHDASPKHLQNAGKSTGRTAGPDALRSHSLRESPKNTRKATRRGACPQPASAPAEDMRVPSTARRLEAAEIQW
jgi:hypothetical protein